MDGLHLLLLIGLIVGMLAMLGSRSSSTVYVASEPAYRDGGGCLGIALLAFAFLLAALLFIRGGRS